MNIVHNLCLLLLCLLPWYCTQASKIVFAQQGQSPTGSFLLGSSRKSEPSSFGPMLDGGNDAQRYHENLGWRECMGRYLLAVALKNKRKECFPADDFQHDPIFGLWEISEMNDLAAQEWQKQKECHPADACKKNANLGLRGGFGRHGLAGAGKRRKKGYNPADRLGRGMGKDGEVGKAQEDSDQHLDAFSRAMLPEKGERYKFKPRRKMPKRHQNRAFELILAEHEAERDGRGTIISDGTSEKETSYESNQSQKRRKWAERGVRLFKKRDKEGGPNVANDASERPDCKERQRMASGVKEVEKLFGWR